MADPTLKDVLAAVATLTREVTAVRREMATKKDVEALDAKTEARFDALDAKLDTFRDVVASSREDARDFEREVEKIKKSVAALKGRPSARPTRPTRRR